MTSRATVGGNQSRGSLHGSKYALPQNSILGPACSALENSKATEAMLNGLTVVGLALFISSFAIGVPVALFFLMFVRL